MSIDPEELIDAGIELVDGLIEDGNITGASQLMEQVAQWIDQNNNGDEIQLGE